MAGPLAGIRVVEFAGIGPAPYAGMLLADLGADVLVIEKKEALPTPLLSRGKSSLFLDLKSPADVEKASTAVTVADVLIEGFRPGVMERLRLGPEPMMALNSGLVYARMTGWGQSGLLSQRAGHDLNYISLTGALAAMGRPGHPPMPPLNLVGDFGGGALFLALGVISALYERTLSGRGQVIDAAIVDGTASLMTCIQGLVNMGQVSIDRENSLLGGSAPHYRCYACADGRYAAVAALEPRFRTTLLKTLGFDPTSFGSPHDNAAWARDCERLAACFLARDRHQWVALFEGLDACVTPVLALDEAAQHPHLAERNVFQTAGSGWQPAPAPRFSER